MQMRVNATPRLGYRNLRVIVENSRARRKEHTPIWRGLLIEFMPKEMRPKQAHSSCQGLGSAGRSAERGEQLGDFNAGKTHRTVGNAIGYEEPPGVGQCAAGIDNVRHIAFAFGIRRRQ